MSAFKRRGKKSALNLVMAKPAIGNGLQHLGEDFVVTPNVHGVCGASVCQLYNSRELNDVNKVRYNRFTSKAATSDQLPPTKDALQLHVARANYQAVIWRRALEAKPNIPSPTTCGWIQSNGGESLSVLWMQQQPAPEELLVLTNCNCRSGCSTGRCSCHKAGLVCTAACTCQDCENCTFSSESTASDPDDEEDERQSDIFHTGKISSKRQ